MSDPKEYSAADLLRASHEQKPLDFEDAFASIMAGKIIRAVDAKKIEIAQGLNKTDEPVQEPEPEEEE